MSYCGELCLPCEPPCPQPWANACNELCVTSCEDSRAVIYPPPVVLTFPGPILSSCPQESVVGSCGPPGIPPGIARSLGSGGSPGSRGYGNPAGLRGSILFGGSSGSGGVCNSSRSYNSGCSAPGRGSCSPFLPRQYSTGSRGSCGPC
ncbi:feather keratin B-4-like [Manacus candei]|uniref:feather keratin B-4-like n=1 Tax=Manacus candei TaxID=415023 RepID=UPI002227E521|nr:feather keratin B-4-like [Manacus candei]